MKLTIITFQSIKIQIMFILN